jgi:ElaB/YqjD/DUF883 family membrane-anchored ribosome-binding protein
MEVYFKELISKDASLEKLVDDLERIVQGADDYVRAIDTELSEGPRREVTHRLHRLREGCHRINSEITNSARATDRLVRRKPYPFIGAAVLLGMIFGMRIRASR